VSASDLLAGRRALVTGAGVRLGRAIAVALGRAGADVAVHHRSSSDGAEATAAEIRAAGRRAVVLSADLVNPDACRTLVRSASDALGGLDLLVHSAANFHRAPLADTDEAIWDDAMNVNARAALLLSREAAPLLRAGRGRVVLISDLLATIPVRGYAAHSVSKAAVEGLVRALAIELAPEVSVNGIAPGTVLVPEGTPPDVAERWANDAPLRRNGDPSEVAQTVVFLCGGPSFITGQVLRVDGGKSLV
jgi:pteridine reductase